MATAPLRIGNVEIVPLLDSSIVAPCRLLCPDSTPEQWLPYRGLLDESGNNLTLSISSFLVRANGKTVLVDTGIGAKDRGGVPNGRLPDAITEAGVARDEIDVVMATHIHVDHVGWHTTKRGDALVPTFPKATHLFAQSEWDYFTRPDVAAKAPWVTDCVLPLRDTAEIKLVDSEYRISDDLTLVPTPGHTPGHVSLAILSAGEAGIIWGDVCHHPIQVAELWSPPFDLNPALARETRDSLLQRIEDERMMVIAGHFAHPGFGRIVRVEGKRSWRAL
jgi:glyoxylase-like metal-dependent hydrolase (beta-lactamase superfamily II)